MKTKKWAENLALEVATQEDVDRLGSDSEYNKKYDEIMNSDKSDEQKQQAVLELQQAQSAIDEKYAKAKYHVNTRKNTEEKAYSDKAYADKNSSATTYSDFRKLLKIQMTNRKLNGQTKKRLISVHRKKFKTSLIKSVKNMICLKMMFTALRGIIWYSVPFIAIRTILGTSRNSNHLKRK